MPVAAMNDLTIAATQSTPGIHTDSAAGLLAMSGDSYPENSFELFGPVIRWVEQFLESASQPLRLELRLLYLNTSSIRAMIDIFDRLQAAYDSGRSLSVNWLYDSRNPRSAEMGEEFKEDYTFDFAIAVLND